MDTIIFDIDGTLSELNGRENFIHCAKPDWKAFFEHMGEDLPNIPVVTLYKALYATKQFDLIIVSGRPERYRRLTEVWLACNHIPCDTLLMRTDGDFRADEEVKQDILNALKKQGKTILLTVDDRQKVVDMWRKNGLTCLQCKKGDY